MKKSITFLFLLLITPLTIFAAQEGIDVANVDKDILLLRNSVLPPVVTEKYEYYQVRGTCEKDLQNQLKQCGVIWSDGKRYDSVTSWHVTWDYGYDRTPRACAADSFHVTVEILFRYPEWIGNEDAPRDLVDKWGGYMKNLIAHENGHRDMALNRAEELTRAVAALPACSTCVELDRKVRELCRERLEKMNNDEREYDITTSHGRAQGAVFP